MKSPNWTRDEAILLLDLYFSINERTDVSKLEQMQELSDTLNALRIHPLSVRPPMFRNRSGIELKLGNLLAIDPHYKGVGIQNGSKLDRQIFEEFAGRREDLRRLANQIRSIAAHPVLNDKLAEIESADSFDNGVDEGAVVFRLHKFRERDKSIVAKKKRVEMAKSGKLVCEVCAFNFTEVYGDLGLGFIECHHRRPLSTLQPDEKTRLKDLALVCSNCHRMLHRQLETLSVEALKEIFEANRL
ncbi:HNH endonuclease [Neolewinella aurantiaca]|uniref:HNH endonuclease n=1 Tax=Neolewinella aurantiaca TaxID=2602767 RepID=A0A5C7FHX6_9BACT|nr:HNH endonuclease [Neolewinella aurantiaca]TXF89343.1 HNH endonuclease [Neolewinella aurantiaca]